MYSSIFCYLQIEVLRLPSVTCWDHKTVVVGCTNCNWADFRFMLTVCCDTCHVMCVILVVTGACRVLATVRWRQLYFLYVVWMLKTGLAYTGKVFFSCVWWRVGRKKKCFRALWILNELFICVVGQYSPCLDHTLKIPMPNPVLFFSFLMDNSVIYIYIYI